MNDFDNESCFTLALYGTSLDNAYVVPLMSDVVELFGATGQPPSHLNATACGFSKNPLLFDRAWKRMQEIAPDDLESVSVRSLIDDWHMLDDWTAVCCIYQDSACFVLSASLVAIPDAEPRFTGLVHRWLDRIRPAYGTGFVRKRGHGPVYYAIGVSYGDDIAYSGPEYEEDLATCRWSDGMHEAVYDQGILRDVYPYSLLTPRHLQRDIDGRPLWAWIQEAPQRGQVASFDDSRYHRRAPQWAGGCVRGQIQDGR